MKLVNAITDYVAVKQSLGMRFRTASRLLRHFAREMGDVEVEDVRPEAVLRFLIGAVGPTTSWTYRSSVLRGFYRFAISRGHADRSPLPVCAPKLPPPLSPYVYSTAELRRLINATSVLETPTSKLQAPTYRVLILLLYGGGLRISEALRMTLHDIDLVEQIITVRQTKFYKTRLVPIGAKLASELATHIGRRRQLALPAGDDSALLATRTGHFWSYQTVITLFQRVRSAAGIDRPSGEPRPPRLHDLRHTAAVHRVVAWYRSGKDVQRLLPQLATYLGHRDVSSTQRYLQMTPELLQEASRRFAHYAEPGGQP
jgi:integrase/recombinase XerD